ncbi:MAG: sigma-54-dependent Fis family transcriptional regulator [Nitrosospira sp.]|nr:sigma-54-dependent Fis family transcriptional regulator [Nitrosospira sp.]
MKRPTYNFQPAPETKEVPAHIRFAPESGRITLFDQRMLLVHGSSLAAMRRELIERLGMSQARDLFIRFGYQQGLEDYRLCHDEFHTSTEAMLHLGPRMRDIEGFVHTEPTVLQLEYGAEYMEFVWTDSWEAAAHLEYGGLGAIPSCWMNIGYGSGFTTGILGRPFLFREVECIALGYQQCRIVGKPLSDWEDIGEDGAFLQAEKFVNLPSIRRRKTSGKAAEAVQPIVSDPPRQEGLVGASPGFNAVVSLVRKVADTDARVLFLGESGVGKEQFARTVHRVGRRRDRPFIAINCAGIPQDLVEAELFGVEKGAFTGATQSRPGRFERADGGTLFLDEVGSLPLAAQGKLLRTLQEQEIERVGGTKVRQVDVRILAATNSDLRAEVRAGEFRTDLFYRLNVYPIEIPPLRARREDVPLLFNLFVERFSERFNKKIEGVTRQARDALWAYDWPGNVRELENMVERAVILCDDGQPLDQHHLFSGGEVIDGEHFSLSPMGNLVQSQSFVRPPGSGHGEASLPDSIDALLGQTDSMEEIETLLFERALRRSNGNISAAARALGIGRGKMQYRLDKLCPRPS